MMQLSINELTTFRWTFDEDVLRYAEVGITALGAWREKVDDFGEEKAAELLAEAGMHVSNLLWAGGFTGHDGRTFRDSVDDGLEAVRLAALLRADCLVVYTGSRARHTHSHARRMARDAVREMARAADAHGVTLAIEPMHAQYAHESSFLHGIDDTLEWIESLGDSRVQLVFDTFHLGRDDAILARIPELAPRIAIVHLADSLLPPQREQNRCRLGEGTIPLREIIEALTAAGYRGYYDVELLGEAIEGSTYEALIEHARDWFTADVLATE